MKKCKRISACLLAVLCLLCALAMPAGAEGFEYGWDQDSNNPNGPHCKAYFMLNLDTHTAVYSNNADEQLPMASLTKIMSYIVAYETIPDIENAPDYQSPKVWWMSWPAPAALWRSSTWGRRSPAWTCST